MGDGGGGHCLVCMEWHPSGWSVNLPLHHKVQKFSSGTGYPGGPGKRAAKRLWCGGVVVKKFWLAFVCCINFRHFLHHASKRNTVHITAAGPVSNTADTPGSRYPEFRFVASTAAADPRLSWYRCTELRCRHPAAVVRFGASRCCHGNRPDAAAGATWWTTYQRCKHATPQCRCAVCRCETAIDIVVSHR